MKSWSAFMCGICLMGFVSAAVTNLWHPCIVFAVALAINFATWLHEASHENGWFNR